VKAFENEKFKKIKDKRKREERVGNKFSFRIYTTHIPKRIGINER